MQLEYSSKVTAMATQLTTKDAEISRLGEKMKSFQVLCAVCTECRLTPVLVPLFTGSLLKPR